LVINSVKLTTILLKLLTTLVEIDSTLKLTLEMRFFIEWIIGLHVVPLWSESAAAGTSNIANRLSCVPGYDSSSDVVPPASCRFFSKYIDESPGGTDVDGTVHYLRRYL